MSTNPYEMIKADQSVHYEIFVGKVSDLIDAINKHQIEEVKDDKTQEWWDFQYLLDLLETVILAADIREDINKNSARFRALNNAIDRLESLKDVYGVTERTQKRKNHGTTKASQ